MEPSFIAGGVLIQLIGLGLGASAAVKTEGIGKEEAELLQKLLSAGLDLSKHGRKGEPRLGAQHLALVVRAFGEAFRRQWYGDRRFAPGSGWIQWLTQDVIGRRRMAQLERCARIAAVKLSEPGGVPDARQLPRLDALLGDPIETPYYRALYDAYSNDLLELGDEPLITNRIQFEREFRLAYAEGLSRSPGDEIRRYLLSLAEDRALVIRELLIRDLATWGNRHVFGNVIEHVGLPPLPLGALYVEPDAMYHEESDNGSAPRHGPVLELLERFFPAHPVVVVRADFGHGKSLTARMLAWNLARNYLQDRRPSSELFRPVFVKCADDFESHSDELSKILRRAQWRLANTLGLDVSLEDPAFEQPLPGRTLYLIDGLDEVALGDQEVKAFFRRMREKASSHCRFIVFTRPAVLGQGDHLKDIPILDLQPFSTDDTYHSEGGQVGQWLRRWCGLMNIEPAISIDELRERGFIQIAGTPILLFMIAFTWDQRPQDFQNLASVYESFFGHIARGKHDHDLDRNRPIAEASAELLERLLALKHLPHGSTPPEAMLWLMSRVAWRAKCLDDASWLEGHSGKRVLRLYEVQKILHDELNLDVDAKLERTIQLGLLLALQADLEEGNARILFGHQSFQEFLIARYWAVRLREAVRKSSRDWERRLDEPLLHGRLLGNAAFKFLVQIVERWTPEERQLLRKWAEECFNDEKPMDGAKSFRHDKSTLLREAALAIGSVSGAQGLVAREPWALRSLFAWFWIYNEEPIIIAPGLQAPSANLAGINLSGANLKGANLQHADLDDARLVDANLDSACLNGATLAGAQLVRASLSRAQLRNAKLAGAQLGDIVLDDATLIDAELAGADLCDAQAIKADLRGANLTRADMSHGRFRQSRFDGAILRDANLSSADLTGAEFSHADLSNAHLSGAEMYHATLEGTRLYGADLMRAKYHPSQLAGADTTGVFLRSAEEDGYTSIGEDDED